MSDKTFNAGEEANSAHPDVDAPLPKTQAPRIALLLGAGASRDAGLQLTADLARIIVERAEGQGPTPPPPVQALNFVYSQMIGHQGEDGDNPLAAVNIETLVSALRLLANRESHEVAPFVATWKAGALGFSRAEIDSRVARDLEDTVRKVALSSSGFPGSLAESIRQIATTPPSPETFKDAERIVLRGIHKELGALKTTDYLVPIADLARTQRGGLDVISLNYDLAIETMAEAQNAVVDRGIDRWIPGSRLRFSRERGTINLIKVHGSLDWELELDRERGWLTRMSLTVAREAKRDPRPWIVVGDREKLATVGPTLALLHSAECALQRAERLIVVGYSFSDPHINTMIQDWMTTDEDRTITIIDPGWIPAESRGYASNEEIDLQQGLAIMAAQASFQGPPRVTVVTDGAASSLTTAIRSKPHELPRAEVAVTACAGAREIPIRISNLGVDLVNVTVTVFAREPQHHVMPLQRVDGPSQKAPNGLAIDELRANQHVDFTAHDQWDDRVTELRVTVSGSSALDQDARTSVTCYLVWSDSIDTDRS